MLNRELIGWRDLLHIVVAAIAVTLIVCGGPYIAAGGPMPWTNTASAAVTLPVHPAKAVKMKSYQAVAVKPLAVIRTAVATQSLYQVRTGDTLSLISARLYGSSRYWTTIYWANKGSIKYANVIYTGQTLVIPAVPHVLAAPSVMSPAPPPQPQQPVTVAATTEQTNNASVTHSGGQSQTYSAGSSFQQCVIRAESGGDPTAQNPDSTASGLYGFLDTTWTAVTGLPGPARAYSVAQQNAAFQTLYSEAGSSPWGPYDGC
jgi:LysM repeat protein